MNRIAIFSGAGLDRESGINTFRDTNDGLWYNYNIEEVATSEAWKKDKEKVLDFHNKLRREIYNIKPNAAHHAIAELDKIADVTNITQNISDLLERAKSKNILHLHGELLKCRSTVDHSLVYDCRGSINIGDKCEKGSQLKPDTVLFGEMPRNVDEGYTALCNADYVIIIGTSFPIGYTLTMFYNLKPSAKVYFVDPNPVHVLDQYGYTIEYIVKNATEGVPELTKLIAKEIKEKEATQDEYKG